MLTLNGLGEIRRRAGEELGVSAWHEVTSGVELIRAAVHVEV